MVMLWYQMFFLTWPSAGPCPRWSGSGLPLLWCLSHRRQSKTKKMFVFCEITRFHWRTSTWSTGNSSPPASERSGANRFFPNVQVPCSGQAGARFVEKMGWCQLPCRNWWIWIMIHHYCIGIYETYERCQMCTSSTILTYDIISKEWCILDKFVVGSVHRTWKPQNMGPATRLALALRVLAYAPVAKHLPGDVANVGASLWGRWMVMENEATTWCSNKKVLLERERCVKPWRKLSFLIIFKEVRLKCAVSWILLNRSRASDHLPIAVQVELAFTLPIFPLICQQQECKH